jgi:lipopolysaccharide transport system ATP-binding protein
MSLAISVENLSKLYRLGEVSTGTLSHDLNRWWHRVQGKEDPYLKIGQVNDRTKTREKAENLKAEKLKSDSGSTSQPSEISAFQNLSVSDFSSDYVYALKDINFSVNQGEVLGIIGRNGAGKSTLLKILSRVTAPTSGRIKVKGRIASLLEVGTGFHPELTGRENIYLNGAILGMRRQEITRKLDEIVEFSGCAAYLDTPVKRYSSGMYVRLAFAVAAHLDPDILVVDEVLAVGDASFQTRCVDKMKDSATNLGVTVLLVSHNLQAIASLATRCLSIDKGLLQQVGSTEKVLEHYHASVLPAQQWTTSSVNLFKGESAGDHRAKLLRVRPSTPSGAETTLFRSESPIQIEFLVAVETSIPALRVGFCLHDNSGAIAFAAYQDDQLPATPTFEPGTFSFRCTIPSGILNSGRYWVSPRISAGVKDWILCKDRLVSFEVLLSHLSPPQFLYPAGSPTRPGVTAPQLTWETSATA